jgi:hypothetical protein
MSKQFISKERYFKFTTLQIGQLSRAIEELAQEYTNDQPFIRLDRTLPDGSYTQNEINFEHLDQICTFSEQTISVIFLGKDLNRINFGNEQDCFSIGIDANSARVIQIIFDKLIKRLDLQETTSWFDRSLIDF